MKLKTPERSENPYGRPNLLFFPLADQILFNPNAGHAPEQSLQKFDWLFRKTLKVGDNILIRPDNKSTRSLWQKTHVALALSGRPSDICQIHFSSLTAHNTITKTSLSLPWWVTYVMNSDSKTSCDNSRIKGHITEVDQSTSKFQRLWSRTVISSSLFQSVRLDRISL